MSHILFQFLILSTVYFVLGLLNKFNYSELLDPITLISLFGINFVAIFLTHKHKLKYYQKKKKYIITPFVKGLFVNTIFGAFFYLMLLGDNSLKGLFVFTLIIYSFLELIIYSIIVSLKVGSKKRELVQGEIQKYEQVEFEGIPEVESLNLEFALGDFTLPSKVAENWQKKFNLNFTNEEVKAGNRKFSCEKNRVNDIRRINKLFIKKFEEIEKGGILLLYYESLENFEERRLASKKGLSKLIITIYYYIFKRGFPKIGFLKQIYFALTQGKDRVISKTEVWGRLSYCGFDVISDIEVTGLNYVLARKTKTISKNPNPTYSPIISLNRVSIGGKIIKIHKVRSMYPYSEFIQKRVFEENDMTTTGKVNEDFRITKLGRIYRKFWIDELPQIIDWLRGEIKLVGIRAMSQHFFSLYPEEYKNLFVKVKPGIISPIFDEDTVGFEGIVEIEQKYLEDYLSSPIKTDIKNFFSTFSQIVKGVRSQ